MNQIIVKRAPDQPVTKYYKYACNNRLNIISAIYVFEAGTNKPLRKYEYFTDAKIYCRDLSTQEIKRSPLNCFNDVTGFFRFDNEMYGGVFQ